MTANYFRSLAARCRTASHDCLELSAKEEFRQLAAEFNAKANELDYAADDFMMWGRSANHCALVLRFSQSD
jgi:hypothetical protein